MPSEWEFYGEARRQRICLATSARDKWLGNLTPGMEAAFARLKTFKAVDATHNALENAMAKDN